MGYFMNMKIYVDNSKNNDRYIAYYAIMGAGEHFSPFCTANKKTEG